MSTPDYTKTCGFCGKEKPHTEFYHHPETPDGLNWHCKSCAAEFSRMHDRKRSKLGDRAVEPESTRMVRNILARRGIPCVTGRKIGMPFVDLAAWACVPVEAKLSRPDPDRERLTFAWRLSHKQRFGIPGLIVFVGMISQDDLYTFIVPGDADWMTNDNGSFKMKGIRVAIDSSGKNWEGIKSYRDRFDLIEEYRIRYSGELAARIKTKDVLTVVEPSSPEKQALSVYDLPLFAGIEKGA